MHLDLSAIADFQQQLREEETPEPEPLHRQELDDALRHGNNRPPAAKSLSTNYKANLELVRRRWIAFAAMLGRRDWKELMGELTFANRGLGDAFVHFLMRTSELQKVAIKAQSTIRVRLRQLGVLFTRYAGRPMDQPLRDHLRILAQTETTQTFSLGREPKLKPTMGPDLFTYHLYFLWVRDTAAFHIGLDRIDDACLRLLLMFTGCRKHELVYTYGDKVLARARAYDQDPDADACKEEAEQDAAEPRAKRYCRICEGVDDRADNPKLRVLCWEDIQLWIIRDPHCNGGRDRLAMQILLRFHKGDKRLVVPTWYAFVEEDLPTLCPISHILAKALAEGVIANDGYQTCAEPFFSTRLNRPAVKIQWKKEWLHKPVFRRTVSPLGDKSDDPLTSTIFDSHSDRLGIAMGLSEPLRQYAYRRGFAECVDKNYRQSVRDQGMRHKPNSTVYQTHYHNARMNAVVQDAFLGRGTDSPFLTILNHMGLCRDENAPKSVSDDIMAAIGPSSTARRLQKRLRDLESALRNKYGRPSAADDREREVYGELQSKLRAARQKHRRKAFRMLYKNYFKENDRDELQKQLLGVYDDDSAKERQVTHSLPERNAVASVLVNMDDDLPEADVVVRKVKAINAMVAYAFACEQRQRTRPARQTRTPPAPDPTILPDCPKEEPKHSPIIPSKPVLMPNPLPLPLAVQPPPSLYGKIDPSLAPVPSPAIPMPTPAPPPPPYSRPQNVPCIFCGKSYTRTNALWDHLEAHLAQAGNGPLSCPHPYCQPRGVVLECPMRFKAHAARFHGCSFRPEPIPVLSPLQGPPTPLTWTPSKGMPTLMLWGGQENSLGAGYMSPWPQIVLPSN